MLLKTFARMVRAGIGARSTHAAALAATALACTLAQTPQALGCGGTPPPPRCAYTVAFTKAAPPVVLLTGGGTFTLPTVVFLALPPSSPPCPPPPYTATVNINVNCTVPGNGFGTATVNLVPGFNLVPVPVTIAPGPPRLCNVVGTASVAFTNGVIVTRTGDTTVCIADPAPGQPNLPRLDMQHLTPEIQPVHPGDQRQFDFLVTNNDPTETFDGQLRVELRSVSKLPSATGLPPTPAEGVYAVADPGPGDNFPIAFPENLDPLGCVPLPPDPQNQVLSEISKPISLAPGEQRVVTFHARPWGMCADGSCGEATIVTDGFFTDGTDGVACTGVSILTDTLEPPQYAWPDSGAAAQLCPPQPQNPFLSVFAQPDPFGGYQFPIVGEEAQLFPPSLPPLPPAFYETQCLGRADDYGRIMQIFQDPFGAPIMPIDSFFDVNFRMEMPPPLPIGFDLNQLAPIPGTPFGFEDVAPLAMGTAEVDEDGDFVVDSFFDITYQLSAIATDQLGGEWPVEIIGLQLNPFGPGFDGQFSARVLAPPSGPPIQQVRVLHDFRGFARLGGPPGPCAFPDITTTGACLPGAPDGLVNLSDFSCYLSLWASSDPLADITTTGVCNPGSGGDGVNLSDFSCYLSEWSGGCDGDPSTPF